MYSLYIYIYTSSSSDETPAPSDVEDWADASKEPSKSDDDDDSGDSKCTKKSPRDDDGRSINAHASKEDEKTGKISTKSQTRLPHILSPSKIKEVSERFETGATQLLLAGGAIDFIVPEDIKMYSIKRKDNPPKIISKNGDVRPLKYHSVCMADRLSAEARRRRRDTVCAMAVSSPVTHGDFLELPRVKPSSPPRGGTPFKPLGPLASTSNQCNTDSRSFAQVTTMNTKPFVTVTQTDAFSKLLNKQHTPTAETGSSTSVGSQKKKFINAYFTPFTRSQPSIDSSIPQGQVLRTHSETTLPATGASATV